MRTIALLSVAVILVCCKSAVVSDPPDVLMIKMRKTRCYGSCPAYTVKLFQSGKVVYTGEYNVPVIGTREFQLEEGLLEIKSKLLEIDPFSLEDQYASDIKDLPTTYLDFYENGKTKSILDYYGSPQKLKDFERLLQETVFKHLTRIM